MATSSPNTRIIAGIQVPDTPLINSMRSFLKEYYDEFTWNHVNRSWVLGCLIRSKSPPITSVISDSPPPFDPEVHAIACLAHDLSWDCRKPGENFCSKDKRFEVDGANAAVKLLREHFAKVPEQEALDARRLQLIWDAIALHTTPSIGSYKEAEVAITGAGVSADFLGPDFPGGLVTWDEWDAVLKEFPYSVLGPNGVEESFKDGVRRVFTALCLDKPETTYDTVSVYFIFVAF